MACLGMCKPVTGTSSVYFLVSMSALKISCSQAHGQALNFLNDG